MVKWNFPFLIFEGRPAQDDSLDLFAGAEARDDLAPFGITGDLSIGVVVTCDNFKESGLSSDVDASKSSAVLSRNKSIGNSEKYHTGVKIHLTLVERTFVLRLNATYPLHCRHNCLRPCRDQVKIAVDFVK